MREEVGRILAYTEGKLLATCSAVLPVEGRITFVRDLRWGLRIKRGAIERLFVVAPEAGKEWQIPDFWRPIFVADPEWVFACYHNEYAKRVIPLICMGRGTEVHETASIGEKGIRVIQSKDGQRMLLAHTGGLLIGDNVYVGPQAVMHSGTFDPTIIEDGVVIGALVNIGHNVRIGGRSIIASSAVFGGSSALGKRCFVACGALVCPGCTVCDDVMIGAGAIVNKSITKPGRYVGGPARRVGDWNGGW